MDLRWEVDIVTPSMQSERTFFKQDFSEENPQYDLYVSHQKDDTGHKIKFEVFIDDILLFEEDGFESVSDAKAACLIWVKNYQATKKTH